MQQGGQGQQGQAPPPARPSLSDVELTHLQEARGENRRMASDSTLGGSGGHLGSGHEKDSVEEVQPHMAYQYAREARKLMRKGSGNSYSRASLASPVAQMENGGAAEANRRGSGQSDGAPFDKVDLLNHQRMDIAVSNSAVLERERSGRGVKRSLLGKLWRRLLASKINVLLIMLPFGAAARFGNWGSGPVFFINFVALLPLASMLGDFTEEVADHVGETVGGLLNASFGNAVEMVIGVQALMHNEIRVVQASMLGSVLSNLLLVMGCCFLFGGIKNKEQRFNAVAAVANLSLLFLATIALVVPTPIGASYNLTMDTKLYISRVAALFLLAMYLQLLAFQMITHRHLFEDEDSASTPEVAAEPQVEGNGSAVGGAAPVEPVEEEGGDDLGFIPSMLGLLIVTVIVAVYSEFLVSSIDGMCEAYKVSKVFVGVILLPIVGNATEHMTAVTMAIKNRMELAMGIAVGSATQVALFVIPFLVLAGWAMDKPMSLTFPPVEIILFTMAVITAMPVLITGSSNWLHGSLLITCYGFIGFALWHEEGTVEEAEGNKLKRMLMGVEL